MTGPQQNILTTAAIPKADIQSDPSEISFVGLDLWYLCHESPQFNLRYRQLAAHGEAWRATTIWILEFWLEIQVDKTKTLEVSSCRICFLRCNGVVEKALCLDKSGKGWNDQLRSLQNYNVVNPIHRIVAERKTTSTLFVFTPPPCNNDDWRNDADVVAVRNGCTFTGWTGRFEVLRQKTTSRFDRQCLWRGNFHDQRRCNWPVIYSSHINLKKQGGLCWYPLHKRLSA